MNIEIRHPDDLPKSVESTPTEQPLDYVWEKERFYWSLGAKFIAFILFLVAITAITIRWSDNDLKEAMNLQILTSKEIGATIKEAQRMAGP